MADNSINSHSAADQAILQDRPISRKDDDLLNRGPFVESLIQALVREEKNEHGQVIGRRATGYVVGLTGRWGLGKSSILELAHLRLSEMDHVMVATFNPWLFSGRDELLSGFFHALRDAMGRDKHDYVRDLQSTLNRYWSSVTIAGGLLARAADAANGTGFWSSLWAKVPLPGKPPIRTPQEERRALELKLASAKAALVVLIDEFDRVEDDEIRAVAQLIKAIGDIRGISYLVAYDADRVAHALGRGSGEERKRSGELYLEKIIHHPIPIRPLLPNDVDVLFQSLVQGYKLDSIVGLSISENELLDVLKRQITSPRELKRMLGAYAVMESAVRRELSPIDILAYCWILTKSPSLRDAIATNFDKLVDDPSVLELETRIFRRVEGNAAPSPVEALGEAARGYESILQFMFPHFSTKISPKEDRATRVSRRRNLIRLLYLGNPPGMISRTEVEGLWELGYSWETEERLAKLRNAGVLPEFLDRVDDFLPELNPRRDAIFYIALSHILTRSSDWIKGPYIDGALVSDAADSLIRLANRKPEQAGRVRDLFSALVADGDLALTPWLLRKHLFSHGLTHHGAARNDSAIFNREETEALLSAQAPRYREAVLNGTALRRLPDMEAVWTLSNAQLWDEDLRQSLTSQLKIPEAVATFAALTVPPGFGTDRSSIDSLCEADTLLATIAEFGEVPEWVPDPWLADCVRRLVAFLRGEW